MKGSFAIDVNNCDSLHTTFFLTFGVNTFTFCNLPFCFAHMLIVCYLFVWVCLFVCTL